TTLVNAMLRAGGALLDTADGILTTAARDIHAGIVTIVQGVQSVATSLLANLQATVTQIQTRIETNVLPQISSALTTAQVTAKALTILADSVVAPLVNRVTALEALALGAMVQRIAALETGLAEVLPITRALESTVAAIPSIEDAIG